MDLTIAPDYYDSSSTAANPVAASATKPDCNRVFLTRQFP